ncbi:hypothetical protein LTV02_05675 [Nocardia yamanashiensis]|uniref:hypothetical protein n=1 Tax=Nocardia yamanashiensis TaxID=209247 RepID=UPI001E2D08FE|nr:hypothetical protein [Nocardia yamanashiensis]UGT42889.1 hypothetical protein LTV02_05675 [Nocardia yamanashiensis]
MQPRTNLNRRIAWGAGVVAGLAAVGLTAPPASADVINIAVSKKNGEPTVGGTFQLLSQTEGTGTGFDTGSSFLKAPVVFTDNGACIGKARPAMINNGLAHVEWTPTTAGQHTLTATHGGNSKSITVTVAPGTATQPAAQSPDCTVSGSASAGSTD